MTERNLLREGFIFNTLTQAGTVSGTQVVNAGEINKLADGDISTTALLVSGTKQTVLDADLGGRWKVKRIELYTDAPTSSGFEMEISDNNIDFRSVVMTGSPGLWSGTLSTTISGGAPRYIRYRHHPTTNAQVREWSVINEDNLVDFGIAGNETSLQIDDAPIGRSSDVVETLTIQNNFTKPAEGFVLIGRTFNEAEDEIEISTSPNGPWVGRNTSLSNQPQIIPWERGDLFNTRVVPSGVAFFNFTNGLANGWSMTGATQTIVDGKLRGQTTTQTPLAFISSEFVTFVDSETYEGGTTRHQNKFAFGAKDADTVRVKARIQTPLQLSNILEGPRLFWKTEQNVEATPSTFRNTLSVLSTAGTALTGGFQDFIFPVASVPTWSGSVRGLAFRPFTVATGINILFDISEISAYNSQGNSIVLDFNPVPSGSFVLPLPFDSAINENQSKTIISFRHRITQDCIITKVGGYLNPSTEPALFLARRNAGGNFPSPGSNFSVPYGISFAGTSATSQSNLHEAPVFWQGQKGDFICATASNQFNEGFRYTPGTTGDAFISVSGVNSITTLNDFASAVNSNTFSGIDRNYLIYYETFPTELGGYKATGTYRTPVFDMGITLPLVDLDFDSSIPTGTSIDSLGQSGFDSVRARASATPARFGLKLGETGVVSGTNQTLGLFLNESALFNTAAQNDQQINLQNQIVSTDENIFVQNLGGAIMYHELKDELWVLDCVLSGTDPFVNTDARPTWDAYSPHTGAYIRSEHVKGNINYGYDGQAGLGTTEERGFLALGMAADYERGDIYIFQKIPGFSVGAGDYYGLILDLNGNFKETFFRSGTLGLGTQSALSSPSERILGFALSFTYASNLKDPTVLTSTPKGVFFVLHDNETGVNLGSRLVGRNISAFRNGNDVGQRNIGLINTKPVSSIPGLGFSSGDNNAPTGLVYNKTDGLLYLHFDNITGVFSGANKKPEFLALRPTFNPTTFQIDYSLTSTSGTAFTTAPDVNGLSKQFLGQDLSGSAVTEQWAPLNRRSPDFTSGITHCAPRDTFAILRNYFGERSTAFPKDFTSSINRQPATRRNLSLLFECGAGNRSQLVSASIPSKFDGLWGTTSGTLQFQDIAVEGVNFPTGRFVQVEYQLNSNSQQTLTPTITSSKMGQGIRIGQIPAGGSTDIYIRTNIPEGRSIGDQVGKLTVFWESEE